MLIKELTYLLNESDKGPLKSWTFIKDGAMKSNMLVDMEDLIKEFKNKIKLLGFKDEQKIVTSVIKDIELKVTTQSGSSYVLNLNDHMKSNDEEKLS